MQSWLFIPKLFPHSRNNKSSIIDQDINATEMFNGVLDLRTYLIVRRGNIQRYAMSAILPPFLTADIMQVRESSSSRNHTITTGENCACQMATETRGASSYKPHSRASRNIGLGHWCCKVACRTYVLLVVD